MVIFREEFYLFKVQTNNYSTALILNLNSLPFWRVRVDLSLHQLLEVKSHLTSCQPIRLCFWSICSVQSLVTIRRLEEQLLLTRSFYIFSLKPTNQQV